MEAEEDAALNARLEEQQRKVRRKVFFFKSSIGSIIEGIRIRPMQTFSFRYQLWVLTFVILGGIDLKLSSSRQLTRLVELSPPRFMDTYV